MPAYTPRQGDQLYINLVPYIPRAIDELYVDLGMVKPYGLGVSQADYLFHSNWSAGHLDPRIGGLPTLTRHSQSWEWNGELFRLRNRHEPMRNQGRRSDLSSFRGLLLQRSVEQQISQPFDFSHADWGSIAATALPPLFTSNIEGYDSKPGWSVPATESVDTAEGALDQDWTTEPKTFTWTVGKETTGSVRFQIYSAATERVYLELDLATGVFTTLGAVTGLVHKGAESLGKGRWLVTITATGVDTEAVRAVFHPMAVGETDVSTALYLFDCFDGAVGGICEGPENTTLDGDVLVHTGAPTPQYTVTYEAFVAKQRPSSDLLVAPWSSGTEAPFIYRWEDDEDVGVTLDLDGSTLDLFVTPLWEIGDFVEILIVLTADGDLRLLVRVNNNTASRAVYSAGPTNLLPGLPTAWGGDQLLTLNGDAHRLLDKFLVTKGLAHLNNPILSGGLDILDECANLRLLPNRVETL
jgi:hypothetical protein